MQDEKPRRTSWALMLLSAGYAAWVVTVLFITSSGVPAQRALIAGTLMAVGGLVCGMGYLSILRRSALRQRQDSLQRLLDKRRREKGY
jgi:uncharacterized membrane protein YidH (DUF202 family)